MVPGQGTRNMQSPTFKFKYAQPVPVLKDQDGSVSDDPVKVLDLLLAKKEYDFGPGVWFLISQCDQEVLECYCRCFAEDLSLSPLCEEWAFALLYSLVLAASSKYIKATAQD
ncbi:hypothetical protein FE257_008646 [Aspergillus nanangensis]|uniref:Uncharacterized protein n=1 Tax=Aspergillus nanangensis TaxID=2582783 RepID=A0AAD4GSJ1_ASPNN|nr:hypothetical protein FE257_008646 [Aspergillus nanangensis]